MAARRQGFRTPRTQPDVPGKVSAPASCASSRSGKHNPLPNPRPRDSKCHHRRPSAGPRPGYRRGSLCDRAPKNPFANWIYLGQKDDSLENGTNGRCSSASEWWVRDDKGTDNLVKAEDLGPGLQPDTIRQGDLLFRNRTDGKVYTEDIAFPNFCYLGRCIAKIEHPHLEDHIVLTLFCKRDRITRPKFEFKIAVADVEALDEHDSDYDCSAAYEAKDGHFARIEVGADIWIDRLFVGGLWVAPLPSAPAPASAQPQSRSRCGSSGSQISKNQPAYSVSNRPPSNASSKSSGKGAPKQVGSGTAK